MLVILHLFWTVWALLLNLHVSFWYLLPQRLDDFTVEWFELAVHDCLIWLQSSFVAFRFICLMFIFFFFGRCFLELQAWELFTLRNFYLPRLLLPNKLWKVFIFILHVIIFTLNLINQQLFVWWISLTSHVLSSNSELLTHGARIGHGPRCIQWSAASCTPLLSWSFPSSAWEILQASL